MINVGDIIQLTPFKDKPTHSRIYEVIEGENDNFLRNKVSIKTALEMVEKELVINVYKPLL